jgi:nitroreductase
VPSRGNSQPWKFIVLEDAQIRKELAEAIPNGKFLAEAPKGIAIVIDPKSSKHPEQEGAAAIQNMLLTAHALWLGACWISVYGTDYEQKAKQILLIPEEELLISVVSVGYSQRHQRREGKDWMRLPSPINMVRNPIASREAYRYGNKDCYIIWSNSALPQKL